MVASLPSWDPPSIRTTLPTSTNLQLEALISASPILLIVESKLGAVLLGAVVVKSFLPRLAITLSLDVGKIQASPSTVFRASVDD